MKKVSIAIVCAVVIISLSSVVLFVSGSGSMEFNGEAIKPRIVVTDEEIRVGDTIDMNVEDVPEGSTVRWKIYDQYLYTGIKVHHRFDRSDLVDVKVQVTHGMDTGSANITIPVKCCDMIAFEKMIKPFSRSNKYGIPDNEVSVGVQIPKSITLPVLVVEVKIMKATSDISVYGRVSNETMSLGYELQMYTGFMKDHSYRAEITPCHYSEFISRVDRMAGVVHCDNGNCAEIEIRISIRF